MVNRLAIGLTYGPQPAMQSEMFPSRTRLSGVSISYVLGAILSGAFVRSIAQWPVGFTGRIGSVGVYLVMDVEAATERDEGHDNTGNMHIHDG
ncbi:MAG TPA: hypothetical protein K8V32_03305 [Enteractinococcus helveticum]|uniref:Uncharacterized protein n=1 Tax=Enteractinococcus helveticum TaxID=1837282 RepID=A0A921FKK4_9MICC|nr:hypothetical protein [Enteractinococcus helveticum]HJF13818.1 hypothetical protein [Enteractinococcus helveticum]